MRNKTTPIIQLYLRLAIGIPFFIYGTDRLGLWGKYGEKNISWGDWEHFMQYAATVMGFLPYQVAQVLAIIATTAEISVGILLVTGYKTRYAALAAGILSLFFAISMAISFGILSPLGYGVFAVSAGGFLLYTVGEYHYSVDKLLGK